jgi:hypothetical protein
MLSSRTGGEHAARDGISEGYWDLLGHRAADSTLVYLKLATRICVQSPWRFRLW